jgi:glucose/arabinose dehydrogenase
MKKLITLFSVLAFYGINAQTLPSTYVQTAVVTGLKHPSDFDWLPDGRYIVTQKGGVATAATNATIRIFKTDGALIGTFYDLTDSVNANGEQGLHGIAVDPDFANNHYIYTYYTYRHPSKGTKALRVVRFTESANVGTNPTVIFNQIYTSDNSNHVGGIIRIRPSQPKQLYIQIGELAYEQGDATKNYANKLINPYGKILRINTDGTIPKDNPFYDDGNPATGNDDRIWSYGHRNSFGMCFNPVTDTMYATENGWNTWDEFNVIRKGGNYGWATCEGNYLNGSTSQPCSDPSLIKPIATWGGQLPAVTGCLFYTGKLMPEFTNHVIVADNDNGILYDLTMGNAPNYDVVSNKKNFADIITPDGLTTIRQGKDECIYALRGGYTTDGTIYRICPKSTNVAILDASQNYLGQNYPNPSHDKSQIDFQLAQQAAVSIELLDITGRVVRTLVSEQFAAGQHTIEVTDLNALPNGTYFYRMNVMQNGTIGFSQTKRMIVLNTHAN